MNNRIFLFSIIGAVLVSALAGNISYGLTETQKKAVQASCAVSQAELQRVWKAEAVIRVNLGQAYETTYQRLMIPFNRRAIASNAQTDQILAITDEYRLATNRFREDYLAYHQTLNEATLVKCDADPEKYYELVTQSRKLLGLLVNTVGDIKMITNQYRGGVEIIQRQLTEKKS